MAKTPMKFPKTMGACADMLFTTREARLKLQKEVDELARAEAALREYIINNMPKTDTGASGKLARVSILTKQVPQVKDWDKFYAYVKKTGQFELLQRRLSDAAIRERWDNGAQVPGVEPFGAVVVSLHKI